MARRGRRGEGSVYWSKVDRRWIARWPLGVVDGRRRSKAVKRRTEDEAIAELEELRRLYGAGGTPSNATLSEYLDGWLARRRKLRASTLVSYRGHVRLYIDPLLGGIPLRELTRRDVERLVVELERRGKSPGTITLVFRTLGAALQDAVDEGLTLHNATRGVELPRIDREPVHALTAAEADAIVEAADPTFLGPLIRLLLGSGLRLGEALGLDQGDLLLDAGFVRVRRSKTSVRAVPVSDDAVAALRDALRAAPRRGDGEPVFYGPRTGERLRGATVSHALPRVLTRAGLDRLAPHALRHGAATLMLAEGVPMRVIAEQLGHRNPALTARVYAHVIPEAQRAAVAHLERRRAR